MKITRKDIKKIIRETIDASYDVQSYLPAFASLVKRLNGFGQEIIKVSWGPNTEAIHREMTSAMTSLNTVVTMLGLTQDEHTRGPMGGKLKPKSQTMDSTTGEYLTKPSSAVDDDYIHPSKHAGSNHPKRDPTMPSWWYEQEKARGRWKD